MVKTVAMRANAKVDATVEMKVVKKVEKLAVWKDGLLNEEGKRRRKQSYV